MDEGSIARYIQDGERNKEVVGLIHNWCSHARVRNQGGVGMIAQQTGLPIGHFAMHCDFAPAGGMAGWHLESSALDFHDRNCVHCDKRQAVRMPNLSVLVGQRDREVIRRREEAERAEAEIKAAHEVRKKQRKELRVGQSAAANALLDDLDALDSTRAPDAKTRVVETVRLAPEILTPPLVDYFFELAVSREAGCQAEALLALRYAKADSARLTAAALRCLAQRDAIDVAADIVKETPAVADEVTIEAAVPALILLARAPRSEFEYEERRVHPAPLNAVFEAWPEPVCRAIQRLLDSPRSFSIRMGMAGLKVLSATDPGLLDRFARTLVTKLTRAHLLIDEDETDRDRRMVCSDLQRAVAAVARHAPSSTDKLVAAFFEGAASEGEARLVRAYGGTFRTSYSDVAKLDPDLVSTVLKRFVGWSSTSKNLEVLNEIGRTLRAESNEIVEAVHDVLDIALGAAAVLDARMETSDAEQALRKPANLLEALDAQNFSAALYHLREVFAGMAATAASRSLAIAESYVDFLSKIDDSRQGLFAVLLKESSKFIGTPEGLRLILPELYSAMVGNSTLVRASAAETLGGAGKRRIDDLPELVLEAFVLLLEDSYVIVHKAAAKALERISLPDALERRADRALLMLISSYGMKSEPEDFLVRWIELYFRRYAGDDQTRGFLADWVIKTLMSIRVSTTLRDLNSISRHLKDRPAYVDLVIKVLEDPEVSNYGEEDAIRLLYAIPDVEVSKRAGDLGKLAVRRANCGWYVGAIVEVLTRVGAWESAIMAIEASWADVPDTVPMRQMKWSRRLQVVAVQFEGAVAASDLPRQVALKAEWESLTQLMLEDTELYAERRNTFPSLFRAHRGG